MRKKCVEKTNRISYEEHLKIEYFTFQQSHILDARMLKSVPRHFHIAIPSTTRGGRLLLRRFQLRMPM